MAIVKKFSIVYFQTLTGYAGDKRDARAAGICADEYLNQPDLLYPRAP